MSKPNPPRTMHSEANLARRIDYERRQRGWTYDATAEQMTKAGCPIQGSAIHRIVNGNPAGKAPRKITVDELVAFAAIFGTTPEELLVPIEVVLEAEARKHLEEVASALADLQKAEARTFNALVAWEEIQAGLDDDRRAGLQAVLKTVETDVPPDPFGQPGNGQGWRAFADASRD